MRDFDDQRKRNFYGISQVKNTVTKVKKLHYLDEVEWHFACKLKIKNFKLIKFNERLERCGKKKRCILTNC